MPKVIFVPLNTNHVLIFRRIIESLDCDFQLLCHDRISDARQYQTEDLLRKLELPYVHFPERICRTQGESLAFSVLHFFEIKKAARAVLDQTKPDAVVLAIDNDPIAQTVVEEAKRRGVFTVLVQEALIRPFEYGRNKRYLSDYGYDLLRRLGIYLNYLEYGQAGCDLVLVGGRIAAEIMAANGIPTNRIKTVGLPKYDELLEKIRDVDQRKAGRKVFLFAASTTTFVDEREKRFAQKLAEVAQRLKVALVVKLHPRAPERPEEISGLMGVEGSQYVDIIKEGDETFDLMKKSDAFITVSSTMILDALLMDRECIVANYLAGRSRLGYDRYDAIHPVENEEEVERVMAESIRSVKSYENKRLLLEDELFRLDGRSGERAATAILDAVASRS